MEKVLGSNQCIKELLDPRKKVGITDRLCTEPATVYTEPDASVFLVDNDHWCSIRTVAFDDGLLRQQAFDVLLYLLEQVWRYSPVRLGHRNVVGGATSVVDGICVPKFLVVLCETNNVLCKQLLKSSALAAGPVEVRTENVIFWYRIS